MIARDLDGDDAMLAMDLEGTHSHAEHAMVQEARGSNNVETVKGVDSTHLVIAELVKEVEKAFACSVRPSPNLVIPGLFASAALAKPRKL